MPGQATDERSRPPEPLFHFLRNRCSTSSGFRVPLPGFAVPLPPESVFHFLRNPCSTSSGIPTWIITPVYFAWFLTSPFRLDTDRVLPFLKPGTREDVSYLLHEFIDITVGFFRGQLIIAFLQGLLFAAGFSLVGLRYGFVIGLALGLLNVIPFLGNMIGLAVAIPIAFFQTDGGWLTCLRVLAAVLVVQQIEGWFLTPKIMGQRTGLHFIAIIVAIFFWGTALGGVLGLILAIPLTAFLASLWHLAREKYIPEIV